MILADTNILVYSIDTESVYHESSRKLVEAAREGKIKGAIFPQNLVEFYAVITSPRRVQNPLDPKTAWEQVKTFRSIFEVMEPGEDTLDYLEKIILTHSIKGANIFDSLLVAMMQSRGISNICTYNTKDFEKYKDIKVKTPEEILKANLQ
jgi:predicted nucleic acid-binding protein